MDTDREMLRLIEALVSLRRAGLEFATPPHGFGGSRGDELVQQCELDVVGNFCLGEVPHDLVDAEFGNPEQVAPDLVYGPRQRRATGLIEWGLGHGVVDAYDDRAGTLPGGYGGAEARELVFKGFPLGDPRVQSEPKPSGALHSGVDSRLCCDENGRAAGLQRFGADLRRRDPIETALIADRVGAPGGPQRLDELLETATAAPHRHIGEI